MADNGSNHPVDDSVTVSASDVASTDVTSIEAAEHSQAEITIEDVIEGGAPVRRRHGRLVTTLVAAGMTLALLVGVGAYVAYQRLFPDVRPDQFTPASVAAFVAVDLDVSRDQQAKVAKLLAKIGQRDGASEATGVRLDDVLNTLLEQMHLTGVDVKRDLTSWLGLRAGFGLWLDGKSRLYALVSVASRDDAKATAGLGRVRDGLRDADMGFVVHDGRAIIAIGEHDGQQAAEAAAAEARKTPLDKLASFQEAKRWLGDGQLATVWLDMERYSGVFSVALDEEMGGQPSRDVANTEKGTYIAGVRATDDGFEARFRTFNAQKKGGDISDAVARLSRLPANTDVGAVVALPDEPASVFSSPASPYGLVVVFLMGNVLFRADTSIVENPSVKASPPDLTDAEMKEVQDLLSKDPASLTGQESKRLGELIGAPPHGFEGAPPSVGEVFQAGLEDPFALLAGATVTVAFTGLAGVPSVRFVADLTSAEAAPALRNLAETGSDDLTVTVRDATVTVESKNYVPGGGKLADDPAFQKVMAGAPAHTELALYADLESALTAAQRQSFPVRTMGLVQGIEGSDHVGMLRVIVD